LLVLWGLVAPAIAWLVTRNWDRRIQEAAWRHEKEIRDEQTKNEEVRLKADRERESLEGERERMRDVYTRFLKGASAMYVASDLGYNDVKRAAVKEATPDFVLSFQQLLLIASLE